jgi:hypothetical protein
MQVFVLVHACRTRRWVEELRKRLSTSLGQPVTLCSSGVQKEDPLPFERWDRALHMAALPDLSGWLEIKDLHSLPPSSGNDRLIIDTVGELKQDLDNPDTVLTAEINGLSGRSGLLAALTGGPTVRVSIVATVEGSRHEVVSTAICIPARDPVHRPLDTVFARVVTLFDAAVRHLIQDRPLPLTAPKGETETSAGAEASYGLSRKVEAAARRLAHNMVGPVVRTADWTIGLRPVGEPSRRDEKIRPDLLRLVPSDHGHFIADPMLIEHGGTIYLFFEEMDHARGLGTLACLAVESDGSLTQPTTVMRRSTHLSYPFVFEHEGQVFMIPETSADRRVELWRAIRMPDQWERCAILLDGVEAVDGTAKYDSREGLWWMFVSVAEPGGSTFDTLSIYFSKTLESGWTAHPLNPVKLDPRSSRPGGPILEEDGYWLRPAQDCSQGYGGALSWCRITDLTTKTFHEEVVERWSPPDGYRGLHTFTRAGDWEAIDLQRRRWRWQQL